MTTTYTIAIIENVRWRCGCSSMVESQPSKLIVRVRFPLPAPKEKNFRKEVFCVSDAVGALPLVITTISLNEVNKKWSGAEAVITALTRNQ